MLKSFFNIALRYLWWKKIYSVLNFVCLTFGLTCSIITTLYILNIFSYDTFHKKFNRLYTVNAYVTFFNGDRFPKEYLSASLTDVLKEHAPEIEKMTRIAEKEYSFIGVFKDFHSLDLAGPIVPTIMQIKSNDRSTILVKYSSGSFPMIMSEIKAVYQRYESETLFPATLFRDLTS